MAKQKSEEYKQTTGFKKSVVDGQKEWRDSLYGPEETHTKICENKNCSKTFTWFGRTGTMKFKNARFCCVSCAHSRSDHWDKNATRYQTIAFQHHPRKCVVCEETRILDVHHLDENRENNDPANLIPLCPTHHRYWHSRYKVLVEQQVLDYIKDWKNNCV